VLHADSNLGIAFADGEAIVREGDPGDCMFVIQAGEVEVVKTLDGAETRLGTMSAGDFFGEMSLFQKMPRAATVRAVGEARVLTIDKRTLLRRIQEDPLLAYNLVRTMGDRIRELHEKLREAQQGEDATP
jgi:CRP/FNR family cyclic AMP-dependent transcriptional regulator